MSETQVVIHVRFAPDGSVTEIGERPESLSAQAWFDRLSLSTKNSFQALSGGRGIFRLPRTEVAALKTSGLN